MAAAKVWVYSQSAGHEPPVDLQPIRAFGRRTGSPSSRRTYPIRLGCQSSASGALVRSDLKLIIDGKRREVTLKTGWF